MGRWHAVEAALEASLIYLGAPNVGLFLGGMAILCLMWLLRWHRSERNKNKAGVEAHHLIMFGLIGIAICAAVAAVGYGWQRFGTQTPNPASQKVSATGNPLWDKVVVFAAKHGAKATAGPRDPNFSMGDHGDGRGPTIMSWDTSLGPWPTAKDGFHDNEVRFLPRKYPKFSTQRDKEEFREALGEVAEIVRQSEAMVPRAIAARNGLPNFIPNWKDLDTLSNQLSAVRTLRSQIGAKLALDGAQLETLTEKYPLFQEEISGILPSQAETVVIWGNFERALNNVARCVEMFKDAVKKHPEDANLHNQLFNNLPPFAFELDRSISALRDWNIQAKRRVDMVRTAI